MCRGAARGADGAAGFVACFWVVPVGLGRARFMSAALTKAAPFSIPRWLIALNVRPNLHPPLQRPLSLLLNLAATACPRRHCP